MPRGVKHVVLICIAGKERSDQVNVVPCLADHLRGSVITMSRVVTVGGNACLSNADDPGTWAYFEKRTGSKYFGSLPATRSTYVIDFVAVGEGARITGDLEGGASRRYVGVTNVFWLGYLSQANTREQNQLGKRGVGKSAIEPILTLERSIGYGTHERINRLVSEF